MSIIDRVVKRLVITNFFGDGWGDHDAFDKLINFISTMKDPNSCMVSTNFDTKQMNLSEDKGNNIYRNFTGSFESPLNNLIPDLLPAEAKTCRFKMILPATWENPEKKRVCLHYAPTGDHYYWRRTRTLARPLAKQCNIGSIIVENPFYGSRKPSNQVRSGIRHVTDVFTMGLALMLEGQFLFSWLEDNGYGPLGISGVSLGGHNASLTAAVWRKPIACVPCLSWSSAAHTFSEGLLSASCMWDILQDQLSTSKLNDIHHAINKTEMEIKAILAERSQEKHCQEDDTKIVRKINTSLQKLTNTLHLKPFTNSIGEITNSFGDRLFSHRYPDKETALYMRLLFDEFTNLKYYPTPVPSSTKSTIVVVAKSDLYITRPVDRDILDIQDIWPDCEIRVLDGGHISSYLIHQKSFRLAIKDAFDKLDICIENDKNTV